MVELSGRRTLPSSLRMMLLRATECSKTVLIYTISNKFLTSGLVRLRSGMNLQHIIHIYSYVLKLKQPWSKDAFCWSCKWKEVAHPLQETNLHMAFSANNILEKTKAINCARTFAPTPFYVDFSQYVKFSK